MSAPTLIAADLKPRTHDVVATWIVEGDLPNRGTWLLSTTLVGGEEGRIHQFGVKVVDSKVAATFVFDHVGAQQHNPVVSPQRVGQKWTVVFPMRDLEIATSGRWTATLNLGGTDTHTIEGTLEPAS